ncbi:MAG: class I SAM-dependent rRNA methyltransferase [Planctomycetota bacterium]
MADTFPPVRLLTDESPSGPWIFGRQVEPKDLPPDGSLVEVNDRSGRFIGHGLYNGASDIRVRLLSRGRKTDLRNARDHLLRRLASADRIRKKTLRLPEVTNAYRIAHAEGDDLPGLVVDRLGDCLVCEHHALGFYLLRHEVESALSELYPGLPVVHRVPPTAAKAENFEPKDEPLDLGEIWIEEHGLQFPVRPGRGHKTGWFCDQRDNRISIGALARDADVLDLCCNLGGFALRAAKSGARRVRGVDLDEVVIARARRRGQEQARSRVHPRRRLRLPPIGAGRPREARPGRPRSAQDHQEPAAARSRAAAVLRPEHARDRGRPARGPPRDLLVLGSPRPPGLPRDGLPGGAAGGARDPAPRDPRGGAGPPAEA